MITDEKYYIFDKKNPIAPLSVLGARHNSQVLKLPTPERCAEP